MRLPANPATASHLAQALFHFNHAFDMAAGQASKVDVARALLDGLNRLQTHWLLSQDDRHLGELQALRTMILLGLSSEAQDTFVRNEQVQHLVAPDPRIMNHDAAQAQDLLLDMLLDRPSTKLIAYGSLAPGQSNHSVVSDLQGQWQACVIRGTMGHKDGWLVFSWDPAGSDQNASLFTSNDLPGHWPRIDQFEGADYRRRLVTAQTQGGLTVGYAYTAAR